MKVFSGTAEIYVNDVLVYIAPTIGSSVTAENLYFAGTPSAVGVYEGRVSYAEFYSINSSGAILSILDRYDFNAWDGSASGTSQNGFPFTVTDGTPAGARAVDWVPVAL